MRFPAHEDRQETRLGFHTLESVCHREQLGVPHVGGMRFPAHEDR
jgi:hypothetical protein